MGRARGGAPAVASADKFSDVFGARRGGSDALAGQASATAPDAPMSDEDLLSASGRIGEYVPPTYDGNRVVRGMNFLVSGETLYKAGTGAAYRGHICLGKGKDKEKAGDGEYGYVALVTYGVADGEQANIVASGPDIKKVVSKLNSQLQSKLRNGKYVPDSDDPSKVKLDRDQVVAAIHARDPVLGGTPA